MRTNDRRPIPDFPGYYITSAGSVWSTRQYKRWLRPFKRSGYLTVRLQRTGITYNRPVHRLVLEAFVGPCPEGMEACHNNGDPTDNRLENLRWDTRSANVFDAVKHGTAPGLTCCGERHYLAKPTDKQVYQIVYLYQTKTFSQRLLADIYGVDSAQIHRIVSGVAWKHLWRRNNYGSQ